MLSNDVTHGSSKGNEANFKEANENSFVCLNIHLLCFGVSSYTAGAGSTMRGIDDDDGGIVQHVVTFVRLTLDALLFRAQTCTNFNNGICGVG